MFAEAGGRLGRDRFDQSRVRCAIGNAEKLREPRAALGCPSARSSIVQDRQICSCFDRKGKDGSPSGVKILGVAEVGLEAFPDLCSGSKGLLPGRSSEADHSPGEVRRSSRRRGRSATPLRFQ